MTDLDPPGAYLLGEMGATLDQLKRWRARGAQVPPEAPREGSDLEVDAEVFRAFPAWQLVQLSLISSVQHLLVLHDTLAAKHLYPSATFTVLRGALVGASQAVWALEPNGRPERRERGLTLVAEMLSRAIQSYEGENPSDMLPGEASALAKALVDLGGQAARLQSVRTSKAKPIQTTMVEVAAASVYPKPGQRQKILTLWREMSGDAHVLAWSMMGRALETGDAPTGVKVMSGRMADTAAAYFGVYSILQAGWSLYDERSKVASI